MNGQQGWEPALEHVCGSLRDVVYVVDEDLRVRFVNDRAVEASGLDREAFMGTPIERLTADVATEQAAVERYVDAVESVLAGDLSDVRVQVPASTGPLGDHVVETRLTPYAPDGEVEGVVGVSRDVTTQDDYERELEARTEELVVLNRLLRHDVRNDMAVVEGWLSELAERVDDEDDRELVALVRAAADHTIRLTENARDYARVVSREAEPELEPVDLGAVLAAELERHRGFAPEATFTVEGSLPSVAVRANDMLASVFTNLLRNAVEHSDREHPTVTVSVDVGDRQVDVRIADDGPGIPPSVRDAVFAGDGGPLDEPDASLGLYLVERLVSAYGGEVDASDNEPRGTVVTVTLPRTDVG